MSNINTDCIKLDSLERNSSPKNISFFKTASKMQRLGVALIIMAAAVAAVSLAICFQAIPISSDLAYGGLTVAFALGVLGIYLLKKDYYQDPVFVFERKQKILPLFRDLGIISAKETYKDFDKVIGSEELEPHFQKQFEDVFILKETIDRDGPQVFPYLKKALETYTVESFALKNKIIDEIYRSLAGETFHVIEGYIPLTKNLQKCIKASYGEEAIDGLISCDIFAKENDGTIVFCWNPYRGAFTHQAR